MSRDILVLLGTQLFAPEHLASHRRAELVMVEDAELCRRLSFHQQKLAFVLAAMRDHRDELIAAGMRVSYFELSAATTLEAAVRERVQKIGAGRVLHFDSDDVHSQRMLRNLAADLGVRCEAVPSPMFLTSPDDVDQYFARKRPRMSDFYKQQRRNLNILMHNGEPVGGRWSFDVDNRKRVPASAVLPRQTPVARTVNADNVIELVGREFPDHPGRADGLWLPTSRADARNWLDEFLTERLTGFGTYEDAITTRSHIVHHSALAPLLNNGLLTPAEVVERAQLHDAPLNDLEGFLRQIIGWREFIRGIYRRYGASMRTRNVWNAERRLGPAWFTGDTGVEPLDHALRGAVKWGWNHHIERLMVIANMMNLCGIAPADVYRFFMTHYVDAYDWVMVPNVFGMGLTSDGGVFASKPYICGSNYLRKMSDHAPGDWCSVVDGLFWRFVLQHRDCLVKNPRMSMLVSTANRLPVKRKRLLFAAAEEFLETHTF
jgi:deoxyribodipyrimidine photolyase-related protein